MHSRKRRTWAPPRYRQGLIRPQAQPRYPCCPPADASACPQVTTEHVLLGLITEDTGSKNGFLNSGLTAEKARAAVQSLSGKRKPAHSAEQTVPFSREVRKTFEAATNVSGGRQGSRGAGWTAVCALMQQLADPHAAASHPPRRSASAPTCHTSPRSTSCWPCLASQMHPASVYWTGALQLPGGAGAAQ